MCRPTLIDRDESGSEEGDSQLVLSRSTSVPPENVKKDRGKEPAYLR